MENPRTHAAKLIRTLRAGKEKRFEKVFTIDGEKWHVLAEQQ